MTFQRKFIAPGELTDAEVQHVVTLATGDAVLMEARKRVVETMAQVVNGKAERDDDLLDDLFGKLAVEIKRVSTTAYSRFGQ